MDKMLGVHHKKPTKQPKATKKKGVKVVYISNPMKIKTSAEEFRSLVQELTGKYADMPDPARFQAADDDGVEGGGRGQEAEDPIGDTYKTSTYYNSTMEDHAVNFEEPIVQFKDEVSTKSDLSSEGSYDYVEFPPQMLENFPGLVSSSLWYQ